MNLTEKGQEFVEWMATLKQVASDKTGYHVNEIKINEDSAYGYFSSGCTPTQCFREAYQSDGD